MQAKLQLCNVSIVHKVTFPLLTEPNLYFGSKLQATKSVKDFRGLILDNLSPDLIFLELFKWFCHIYSDGCLTFALYFTTDVSVSISIHDKQVEKDVSDVFLKVLIVLFLERLKFYISQVMALTKILRIIFWLLYFRQKKSTMDFFFKIHYPSNSHPSALVQFFCEETHCKYTCCTFLEARRRCFSFSVFNFLLTF